MDPRFDPLFVSLSPWDDPAAWLAVAQQFQRSFTMEFVFYAVGVLLLWLGLHVLLRRRLAHRLIGAWPQGRDMRREAMYSLTSMMVFAAISLVVFAGVIAGRIEIDADPTQHGWWWAVLSLPALILWHDAYFYVTHRLLHTPWWFRHVHGLHHRSRHPSPWAAYAFHPIEALINGLYVPLALLVVPLPGIVLFAAGIHQIVRNAHGHAAVEVMPRGFIRHWLGGRFTTTTHHHLHHEFAQGNYGLWFTWWDRWLGTERADYFTRFEQVTRSRAEGDVAERPGLSMM